MAKQASIKGTSLMLGYGHCKEQKHFIGEGMCRGENNVGLDETIANDNMDRQK